MAFMQEELRRRNELQKRLLSLAHILKISLYLLEVGVSWGLGWFIFGCVGCLVWLLLFRWVVFSYPLLD